MSFNKIVVVGNLGREPELRYTPQGKAICNFTIATNEKRKDKDGQLQEIATWFKVTVWGQQAENASKYLNKGSQVYVEGRLTQEEWTDRDGNNRTTLGVNATDIQYLSKNSGHVDDVQIREEPLVQSSVPPVGEVKRNLREDIINQDKAKAAAVGTDDDIPF